MSDAGSGGRFPFLRRNKNSDTPNAFPQSMDPIAPTTGEIHQVFAPSTPRHAATTSDVTCQRPPKAWTNRPNANMPWRWRKA